MKAESRAKYPGVKLHLDDKECLKSLAWLAKRKQEGNSQAVLIDAVELAKEVAKIIRDIQADKPEVFAVRTEEEVEAALLKDKAKIEAQLSTMKSGKDWKAVE